MKKKIDATIKPARRGGRDIPQRHVAVEVENTRSPYRAIGDKCRLSERTIRTAFSGKPVTWQTACRIANAVGIDIREFRVKDDRRGRRAKRDA